MAEEARELPAVLGLKEHTDNAFRWAVIQMADRLATPPGFFVAVMSNETGGTFSPSIQNGNPPTFNPKKATGLIQFMPDTARRLGTTTRKLYDMSAIEQLEYVEKYYRPFKGRMRSVEDVYMATFMPIFVGKPANNVVGRQGDTTLIPGTKLTYGQVYAENKGFDFDHDGVITNGEVGSAARGRLAAASTRPPIPVTPESAKKAGRSRLGLVAGVVLVVVAGATLLGSGKDGGR